MANNHRVAGSPLRLLDQEEDLQHGCHLEQLIGANALRVSLLIFTNYGY